MSPFSRRNFLGLAGAGLALSAAQGILPRRAFAGLPSPGSVRRLLILHAGGGMRSTCLFNADVTPQWNPFGKVGPNDTDTNNAALLAPNVAWGVGSLLAGDKRPIPLTTWGAQATSLPLVTQIADKISVIASVDHDPGADAGDGNHYSATLRMCTGAPDGQTGFLTMLSKELDGKAALPPCIVGGSGPIGASMYGIGTGDTARYRPIFLNGVTDFRYVRADSSQADPDYVKKLEPKLDADYAAARPRALDGRPGDLIVAKQLGLQYGKVLATDALRVPYAPTAALGKTIDGAPLTNAMLAEVFGVQYGLNVLPTADVDTLWGPPTALAIRLFQLGAPAVAVGVGGWDFHSEELQGLGKLAASLGRAMSALYFALSRVADPDAPGKTYWDTTLIVTTSEFCRDNTSSTTDGGQVIGFNRGDGSDHHGTPASRYQALPIMGGVVPGGRVIAPTDQNVKPTGQPVWSQSILATMMQSLGGNPASWFPGTAPATEVFG